MYNIKLKGYLYVNFNHSILKTAGYVPFKKDFVRDVDGGRFHAKVFGNEKRGWHYWIHFDTQIKNQHRVFEMKKTLEQEVKRIQKLSEDRVNLHIKQIRTWKKLKEKTFKRKGIKRIIVY